MAPYRTGIPTLLRILPTICRLLTAFRPIVVGFLTVPQLNAWDALLSACQTFEELITHPNLGD